jgi:hypothetical protein
LPMTMNTWKISRSTCDANLAGFSCISLVCFTKAAIESLGGCADL